MRNLNIGGDGPGVLNIPLQGDDKIAELVKADVLYGPCCDSEQHDLHLNPEHDWTLEDVEKLLGCVVIDSTPWR